MKASVIVNNTHETNSSALFIWPKPFFSRSGASNKGVSLLNINFRNI